MKIKFDCPIEFIDIGFLVEKYKFDIDTSDPDCLIVNPGTNQFLDKKYFGKYENLKVVGTPSTGVNHLDMKYLKKRKIDVYCLLDNREKLETITASAEFTWLHIMNGFRKFNNAINSTVSWRSKNNEERLRSNELSGKTIGIIGFGRIGRKIARYATTFEMNVKYYDPYVDDSMYEKAETIEDLNDSDAISINCYLTDETKGLITTDIFRNFKDGLIVVNTSRGEVVDEDYIAELVEQGKIIYACDVLQNEQDISELFKSKLFKMHYYNDNLTVTPHVAGATIESQTKALETILELCIQ